MHNPVSVASAVLQIAFDSAFDQSPEYVKWMQEVDDIAPPNCIVEQFLFWEFSLPRRSGKTTAILSEAGPGDVVLCRDVRMAKEFQRLLDLKDKVGVQVFSVSEFHFYTKIIRSGRHYFSNTFFFDECVDALGTSKRIHETLYLGHRPHPLFFSMKT